MMMSTKSMRGRWTPLTRLVALAGAVTAVVTASGGEARADCVSDCMAGLCAGRGATMVTGPLVFEGGELRVVVETVVRQGSDTAVAVGARIPAGYDVDPQAAAGMQALVMVSGTPGSNAYARWFPIDGDGRVRCVDPLGNPAAGRGSPPADVASASDQDPTACRSRLEAAGYVSVPCQDEPMACAMGRAGGGPARPAAEVAAGGALPLLLGLALTLVRRRR